MTRATAPILTADYYTYSTYSPKEDYYGGYDPKHETESFSAMQNAGPPRLEPTIRKNKARTGAGNDFFSAHCLSFIYLLLACFLLSFDVYAYYHGIRNKAILYMMLVLGFIILTCIMMHLGITCRQPFLCIPFVVCRTMEMFTSACFLAAFSVALCQKNSELMNFFVQCLESLNQFIPGNVRMDLREKEASYQFCLLGILISLVAITISLYVCLIAFRCTMSIADQLRFKRIQKNSDSSRARIASDEFYCA